METIDLNENEISIAIQIEELERAIMEIDVLTADLNELHRATELISLRRYHKEILGGILAKKIVNTPWR